MTDKTDNNQKPSQDTPLVPKANTTTDTGAKTDTKVPPTPPPTKNNTSQAKADAASPKSSSSSAIILAIIAIVLAIVLAVGVYWHGHQQAIEQAEQIESLEQRLKQQQTKVDGQLQDASASQKKQLAKVTSGQDGINEQLDGMSRKLLDLDSKRPNDWMLAEAEYLVRMAGRKLWLEKDTTSSAMMLANADERLASLNDPSLTPVRRALADDIANVKSVKNVDREGIVIKLNSLIDQVGKLELDGVIMARAEEPDFTVSESVSDWKENLKKSWNNFSDNFVTVRRRDGQVEALLSPQQHWYLDENLKGKLLQAQLAVYRDQQEVYDSSLTQAQQWLETYFADNSVRQFMLEQIDELSKQQIKVDYPEQFSAQDSLKQLLDDRLQRLLTSQ